MRVLVAGPTKVRAGKALTITAKLRGGMTYAFCEVYSSVNGAEPSPHVPLQKLGLRKNGAPAMVGATIIRLTPLRRSHSIELVADELSLFYVYQDIDVTGDRLAKARITINGTAASTLGRLLGNLGRLLRLHHGRQDRLPR